MDLCVIPPFSHLRQFPQRRHLVLSHLLQYKPYRDYYEERRQVGDYLILDNSAHENGLGEGPGKLLLQVQTLMPQEVVVPDCLEDSERTIDLAFQAVDSWYGSGGRMQTINPRLMYVPQGESPRLWHSCLEAQLYTHYRAVQRGAQKVCTIGISKDYSMWEGGLRKLLFDARTLLFQDWVEVHLLGSGHDFWTAAALGREFKIRSVDTAKPFVWAMYDLKMYPEHFRLPATLPPRPRDYFFQELSEMQLDLAKENVQTLREMIEE